jgi:glycosyltransferase involved in cell wall biosynthesis
MASNQRMKVSLVIPAYNEEKNIELAALGLIGEFNHANIPLELVLVDNGSHDNTASILDNLKQKYPQIKTVTIKVNEGFGWGITNGLKLCKGDYVGYLGADSQIDSKDVVKVAQKLESEGLDLCKVDRVRRNDGLIRIILSKYFNILFFVLYQVPIGDVNGSPKIMKYACYKKLNLISKDWFIDAETMIKAAKYDFKVGKVNVEFKKRDQGSSHVKFGTILEFMKNLIRYKKVV